jgi:hypothetical protein
MTTTAADIAITIQQQIGRMTLMCIAAHNFVALPETDKVLGGLQFKIGRNPKLAGGWVTVYLNTNDTYTVKIQDARGNIRLEVSDVYCDNLGGKDGVIQGVTG